MEPWLDSLSEDWASQPRESPSVLLPSKTPSLASDDNSFASNGSRLPRLSNHHSLSASLPRVRPSKSAHAAGKPSPILAEHSFSKLNIAAQQGLNKSVRRSSLPKLSSRAASETSNPSVQHHSLQHRSSRGSVVRDERGAGGETPEWKRRLMKGEGMTKDQKDLFSPMGLESVFRPPTIGNKGDSGMRVENAEQRKRWAKLTEAARDPASPDLGFSMSKRGSTMKRPEMEVLEEASEEGSLRARAESAPKEYGGGSERMILAKKAQAPSPSPGKSAEYIDTATDDPRARTISGQEELRNEVISPILVSKTSTADKADCRAHALSMQRLHGELEKLAVQERERPTSKLSDDGIDYGTAEEDDHGISHLQSQNNDWTTHSLPDDLSVGTPDIVPNGPFVNLRRGGYSRDGSFHKRVLSASSFPSSLQLSMGSRQQSSNDHRSTSLSTIISHEIAAIPPAAPTPPAIPSSPPITQKTPSSGSPLKLFGKYDTFTNDKLLKRMSQYEETFEEIVNAVEKVVIERAEVGVGRNAESSGSNSSQFGSGQLDAYGFDSRVSSVSFPDLSNLERGGSPALPRNIQRKEMIFQHENVHLSEKTTKRIVKVSQKASAQKGSGQRNSTPREGLAPQSLLATKVRNVRNTDVSRNANGSSAIEKRPISSPQRGEPVVKRQRTLLKREMEAVTTQLHAVTVVEDKHTSTKTLAGQKRKDARYENDGRTADPDVLAKRHILRPRNPTPGQAKAYIKQQIAESPELARQTELQSLVEHLEEAEEVEVPDSKTEAVAGELASFGVGIAQMMSDTRKGSITTQDFLKEATKIMDIIRAKGRPSRLSGLEESNEEDGYPQDPESTGDQFSRPPSREGGSMRIMREPRGHDPCVLSHLRKFEDRDDLDLLEDTQASFHLGRKAGQVHISQNDDALAIPSELGSSPSNIRIRDNPLMDRKRKHSTSTALDGSPREHHDVPTHSSSGESTNRSIPTASSSSSGMRGIIPSEKVSHLIPEQIGGMTFDRTKQRWIKNYRSSDRRPKRKGRTESNEDDPFKDIPDLSVDEKEELRRREALISRTMTERAPGDHPLTAVETIEEESDIVWSGDVRPHTREGPPSIPPNTSSVPSKDGRFQFSVPQPDTRATSWGEEDIMPKLPSQRHAIAHGASTASNIDDVEHEIRIHEGRVSTIPNQNGQDNRQARAVTIAFSSPLVSHVAYQDEDSSLDNDYFLGTKLDSPLADQFSRSSNTVQTLVHQYEQVGRNTSRRSQGHEGSRRISVDGRPFLPRSISRIDEQNEESPVRDLSLVHQPVSDKIVTTPVRPKPNASMALVPSAKGSNWSFHLSPLPEFTVGQVDNSHHLEVSYIAGRMHHSSLRQVHGTFALAVEEMVKQITDIEPYEPYWEYLRRLSLQGKGLISLHRLREFCSRLEILDVSSNEIGQVADLPYTVRDLKIQKNCLSNMTSWAHLTNLQYLDVSGNQLESLDGLGCLVHLRELRANENKIRNIDGVLDLDGLLVLHLSGNHLAAVDFEASELTRLHDLDLSGNELTSVKNLNYLASLETLDLGRNNLDDLSRSTVHPLARLQSLRLEANKLTRLDVRPFPSLHLLYVDGNNLTTINNISDLIHLDSLSIREQHHPASSTHLDLPSNEARKLYLSSNFLPSTLLLAAPSCLPFLNLQYLEISHAGLETLPHDFGRRAPNLRSLNLNFNALKDITPLLGIVRLNKLLLAGNRLSRLRKTCTVLARFTGLTKLDLRNNPLSVGFYPPLPPENRVVVRGSRSDDSPELQDPYSLPGADEEVDRKYGRSLDEGTRMRRRGLELMLASGNAGLRWLDGLGFEAGEILGRRDEIWEGMVRAGVLRRVGTGNANGDGIEELEEGRKRGFAEKVDGEAAMT